MHGKNFEKFDGTNTAVYEYIDKEIKYEEFGFELLFEKKDKELNESLENLSEDAKICRGILSFWASSNDSKRDEFFRSRYIIINWLHKRCSIFLHMYSGSTNKTKNEIKIEQINKRVVPLLDKLTFLSLLESQPAESKNHLDITEYKFTELGKLVALLLEFDESSNNDYLINMIYDQAQKYYLDQNYSSAYFYIFFFINCYKEHKEIFKIIIHNLLCIIKDNPSDKDSILFRLKNFPILYDNSTLFKILIKSLEEFRLKFPEYYNKFIYKLKLAVELFVERNCKNVNGFEKLRYENNGLHSVVLEGYCSNCKYIPYQSSSMFYYFRAGIKNPDGTIKINCPICNSENSLTFEVLP